MKIFIFVDGEGATGVVSYDRQSQPGSFHYQEARENLMSDLNSAVEGTVAGGASEIVIYDMHYWGLNVIISKLHPAAKVVMGKPKVIAPENGLDETCQGLMMVGFHAKAETPGALLAHTYSLEARDLSINGLSVGEIGMETALAGEVGVPLIFVSGDSKCLDEARAFSENVEVVAVKEPIANHGALCLPTAATAKLIKQAAERAVRNISSFVPYKIDYPVTVEIEYYDQNKANEKLTVPGVKAVGPHKVSAQADSLRQAWLKLKPE